MQDLILVIPTWKVYVGNKKNLVLLLSLFFKILPMAEEKNKYSEPFLMYSTVT